MTMKNPKKFTLKLEANEYIVTAYARIASGPGWKNRPLWVIIGNSETGKMKEKCIQPEEQTADMRTLYSISALASAEMTAAVERIATKTNVPALAQSGGGKTTPKESNP